MKELIQEAKSCTKCTQWHHHCKSECCKIVFMRIHPSLLNASGKNIIIKRILTKDMQWYYKMRGVRSGTKYE